MSVRHHHWLQGATWPRSTVPRSDTVDCGYITPGFLCGYCTRALFFSASGLPIFVHMSLRKRDTESYTRTVVHYAFLNYSCLDVAYCACLDVTFLPEIVKLRFLTCVMAGVRFGPCLTYVLVCFLLSWLLMFYFLYFEYDFIINNNNNNNNRYAVRTENMQHSRLEPKGCQNVLFKCG